MILLKLAAKSLGNRRFTTTLTIFSIGLSVALLIGVERVRLGIKDSFSNTISHTDLIVGARGSPLQLLLYTVFHIGDATNNISWKTYEHFKNHPEVAWTIPISLGDSHKGFRVVATDESFYKEYRYRSDKGVEFSDGSQPEGIFDVVLGADVARNLKYELGAKVALSHGVGEAGILDHADKPFHVVGILKKTGTPLDRSLYINLYGMEAIHIDWKSGGPPLPGQEVKAEQITKDKIKVEQITSFLLRTKSRISLLRLQREIDDYQEEALTAAIPGVTLMKLWSNLGYAEDGLRVITIFVVIVGFLGMLLSIYTSLNERRREMAILRVLGIGPLKILFLLVLESTLLTFTGIVVGVCLIYFLLYSLQPFIENHFGLFLEVRPLSIAEWTYLALILAGGFLIGLVPAVKAYRNALSDGLSIRV